MRPRSRVQSPPQPRRGALHVLVGRMNRARGEHQGGGGLRQAASPRGTCKEMPLTQQGKVAFSREPHSSAPRLLQDPGPARIRAAITSSLNPPQGPPLHPLAVPHPDQTVAAQEGDLSRRTQGPRAWMAEEEDDQRRMEEQRSPKQPT
ncbi:hypothetical protein H8959_020946 [Pygathrix nigripes]